MANITRFYTMTDGAVLIPANLNEDVHSAAGGRGIVSEPNGGLDSANFDATFAVERHLIYPGEAVRMGQDGSRESLDFYDKAFGQSDATNFVPIAGVATRMYVPFDCAAMLCEWQFFFSLWRTTSNMAGDPKPAAPVVRTKAFLNGSPLQHTVAGTPETIFPNAAGTVIQKNHEHLMAENRFGNHLELNVTKGWHEINVQLYMAPQPGTETLVLLAAKPGIPVEMDHRLTAGFRNARLIPFL